MAVYKAGDRVRIVKSIAFHPLAVGHEAIVIRKRDDKDDAYILDVLDYPPPALWYWAYGYQLTPLVDDATDQFIARIKKLGSEPINDAPKVTVREGK